MIDESKIYKKEWFSLYYGKTLQLNQRDAPLAAPNPGGAPLWVWYLVATFTCDLCLNLE